MAVGYRLTRGRRLLFAALAVALFLAGGEVFVRLFEPWLALRERVVIPVVEPLPDRRPPYPPPPDPVELCAEPLLIRPPALSPQQLGDPALPPTAWFPAEKPSAGKRVFIVGESAAWGDGVEYGETFAGLLAAGLKNANVEVINAARNGVDSAEVARTAAKIIHCYAPDLLFVMTGNNEWLNWRPRPGVPLGQRLHQVLGKSRFYRALIAGVRSLKKERKDRAADRGELARFDENRGCEPDRSFREPAGFDPQWWLAYRGDTVLAFRHNLEQIVALAKQKGVPVWLATMPVRQRLCPAYFVDQPHASLCPDDRRLAEGRAALSEGNAAGALKIFSDLAKACFEDALAPYFAGRAAEALGKRRLALSFYRRAREATVGNLGGMATINIVIRQTAEATGTPRFDTDEIFHQSFADPLDSDQLFLDFCHLNATGHLLLAELFLPQIQSLFGLPF